MVILSLEPVPSAMEASGAAVHIRTLLISLAERGHEILVLTFSPGDDPPLITHRVGPGPNLPIRYARQIATLLSLRLTRQIDVLYTRTSLNATVGLIVFAMRGDTALVCEVNGFATQEWRQRDHERSVPLSAYGRVITSINRGFILRAERSAILKADRLVAVTEGIRRRLIAEYGISGDRIRVIENGADTNLFVPLDRNESCREAGLSPIPPYICYVGTFMPWHALPVIIEAMHAVLEYVPGARLLLVGDGDGREAAEVQARTLGIAGSVTFTGRVPHDRVPLYIAASSLCVATFTSERNDEIGLSPLKVYEYLACGRPVVASAIEGVTEAIDASCGGITVPPGDPAALAAAILDLLNDPERSTTMGRSGRTWVEDHRSWDAAAAEMAEVMHEACDHRR